MLKWNGNQITYFGHSTFGLTTRTGQFALIPAEIHPTESQLRAQEIADEEHEVGRALG